MVILSEKQIEDKIKTWLKRQDCEFYKVHGSIFQRAGEPDITGSIRYKGIVVHFNLEVKTAKGKLSRIQEERLKVWGRFDRMVGVVRSVDDLVDLLNDWISNVKA